MSNEERIGDARGAARLLGRDRSKLGACMYEVTAGPGHDAGSSFAYLAQDFAPVGATADRPRRFALELQADADLIGDCYLDFQLVPPANVAHVRDCKEAVEAVDHRVLEHCTFSVDGAVLERLTGDTIRILANSRPELRVAREVVARDLGRPRGRVMVPLPFFFTHSTRDFFPQLAGGRIRFECALVGPEGFALHDVRLVYRGAFSLDDAPARSQLFCRTVTHKHIDAGNACIISLGQLPERNVEDFQMIADGTEYNLVDTSRPPRRYPTTIDRATLRIDGHDHSCLNRLMLTQVIPRSLYGLADNEAGVHYLPVCQDPPTTFRADDQPRDMQLMLAVSTESSPSLTTGGAFHIIEVILVARVYDIWTLDADGKFTLGPPPPPATSATASPNRSARGAPTLIAPVIPAAAAAVMAAAYCASWWWLWWLMTRMSSWWTW